MRFSILLVLVSLHQALTPAAAEAQTIDADANVVELRESCTVNNVNLRNCFETSDSLTQWLWGTTPREPNSLDPVTVRVGPGEYGPFICDGSTVAFRGFVSLEGAGRDVTRFVSDDARQDPPEEVCRGGVTITECTGLSFRNVTTKGIGTGARWFGQGDSHWQDVDFVASNQDFLVCQGHALAWYDHPTADGNHLFSNCRFDSIGSTDHAVAFFNNAAKVRAYGSDFKVVRAGTVVLAGDPRVVLSRSSAGMSIFAGTVRGKVDQGSDGKRIIGLESEGSGVIRMYAGIINVDASDEGSAVGVQTTSGQVHTAETAFNLKGDQTDRILVDLGGIVESPFLWPSDGAFPAAASQTGADLFVKTNEGPGENEARLLLYDSGCSPPWRSVTGGNCI